MNAGWDEKMLASELRELEKDGMDLAVVGFSDEELEALLEDGEQPPEDVADEVTEPPAQPVTQPGDVWLIGNHRLICGDCRDGADRKSTRLNSSHLGISYAVFCLKKKNKQSELARPARSLQSQSRASTLVTPQ